MKTITESFPLPCTPDQFWTIFLDEDYTKALYSDALGFRSFQILEKTDTSRRTLCSPKVNLPGPIAKLMGDSFAYEEHGTLDRDKGEWTWKMVQPAGVKKPPTISSRGVMRVTADGASGCRRSDEVIVEAKVFGLGGMIESTIEKEVRAGWAKEIAFFKTKLPR